MCDCKASMRRPKACDEECRMQILKVHNAKEEKMLCADGW